MIDLHYLEKGYWKNKNIYEYLNEATKLNPDKEAVIDEYGRHTYSELDRTVRKLAGSLIEEGVKKGDVVSFQIPNWWEAVIIHLSTLMIGAVSNPITPIYRKKELKYILETSNSRLLFVPYEYRKTNYVDLVKELIDEDLSVNITKVVYVNKFEQEVNAPMGPFIDFASMIEKGKENNEIAEVTERDYALLMYTSGTTAAPKGVLHSHNTLIHEANSVSDLYDLNEDDVIFMPSPVTHIAGSVFGLEAPYIWNATVFLQDRWDSKKASEILINEGCTWTVAATPFLKGLVDAFDNEEDINKIKMKAFACGGADVPPELVRKATKKLGFFVTRVYGSTEYPTFACHGYDASLELASTTDGKIFEGSSGKVVDDNGEILTPGSIGELAVKGPEMFLGYLQKEFNLDSFTDDGYFLTGDLAKLSEDGVLEIVGRKKDIIIRNGENISVKEVEDVLFSHPKISQVAIVGVPDEMTGEKGCAFITLKDGQQFEFQEMFEYLDDAGIARQKIPERMEVIDEMPMTLSGKIQKFVLRDSIDVKKV